MSVLTRRMLLPLCLLAITQGVFAKNKVDGDWEGALENGKLPMIFHLRSQGPSSVDSPNQHTRGLPAMLTVEGNDIKVDLPGGAARFDGTLKGSQIVGTFEQGGSKWPLTLSKMKGKKKSS